MAKKRCLEKLIWSLNGSPWCKVAANVTIKPNNLEYSIDGSPTWVIKADFDPLGLQFSLDGSPWCRVAANETINCSPLNYSKSGSPWWAQSINCGTVTPPPEPSAFKFYKGSVGIPKIYIGSVLASKAYFGSIEI